MDVKSIKHAADIIHHQVTVAVLHAEKKIWPKNFGYGWSKEFYFCTKVSENTQTVSQGNSWLCTQCEFSSRIYNMQCIVTCLYVCQYLTSKWPAQDSRDLWTRTNSMYMIFRTKLCFEVFLVFWDVASSPRFLLLKFSYLFADKIELII